MENKEMCTECGGVCCKHMGCHYSPSDFEDLSYDGLKKEFDKGHISIDWWEGQKLKGKAITGTAYFLRVRNVNANVIDPSWGGRCMLLTETGCPLEYEKRPKGGRLLVPNKTGRCKSEYGKDDCAEEWYEYSEIIEKLYQRYRYE